MPNYIVYRLDGAGRIRGSEWIEAASDRDALARAARLAEIGGCEVWQLSRRVGQVPGCNVPLRRQQYPC